MQNSTYLCQTASLRLPKRWDTCIWGNSRVVEFFHQMFGFSHQEQDPMVSFEKHVSLKSRVEFLSFAFELLSRSGYTHTWHEAQRVRRRLTRWCDGVVWENRFRRQAKRRRQHLPVVAVRLLGPLPPRRSLGEVRCHLKCWKKSKTNFTQNKNDDKNIFVLVSKMWGYSAVSNESIYFAQISQMAFWYILNLYGKLPLLVKKILQKDQLKVPKKKRKM